jgi:ParB-like chromosome segregation protein Spo0J
MEIKQKNPADLIPYANNAKQHSDEQITKIAASIKEFGFNAPVLIDDDNGIIAGHGRVSASIKLNLTEVPTINLSHLSEAQKKAYILADNRLGEVGTEWDFDLLSLELQALSDCDFDIDLTGFDDSYFLDNENKNDSQKEVNYKEVLEVVVECETEDDQERVYERMTKAGYECRILSI